MADGELDAKLLERIHEFLGSDSKTNPAMTSVICFLYLYAIIVKAELVRMVVEVESDIPLGAGLGSSAAFSVCLAAGLISVRDQLQHKHQICEDKGSRQNNFENLRLCLHLLILINPLTLRHFLAPFVALLKKTQHS